MKVNKLIYILSILILLLVTPVYADENIIIGVGPGEVVEETVAESNGFIFYDCIPLSAELQEYIWNKCNEIGLDYCLALAIIERESTFRTGVKHTNNNGTRDLGLWQINSCNWNELKRDGIITCGEDLYDPFICTNAAMWELAPIVAKYGNCEKTYAVYNTGNPKINSNKNSRVVMQYFAKWQEQLNSTN